jgi:aspartyl/asparaginyl-tRNA synthetase
MFTLNRVPTKSVDTTPYKMSDKLTPKLDKCFLVGYPRETKWYYFYNKAEGKVLVARNDVFIEKVFLSKRVSGSKVQLEEIQETSKNVSAPTDPIQEYKKLYRHLLKH